MDISRTFRFIYNKEDDDKNIAFVRGALTVGDIPYEDGIKVLCFYSESVGVNERRAIIKKAAEHGLVPYWYEAIHADYGFMMFLVPKVLPYSGNDVFGPFLATWG